MLGSFPWAFIICLPNLIISISPVIRGHRVQAGEKLLHVVTNCSMNGYQLGVRIRENGLADTP
jgi:hypothetical protein